MRKLIPLLALLVGCAAPDPVAVTGPSQTALTVGQSSRVYLVQLQRGANPEAVAASAGASPRFVYRNAVTGFAAELNDAAVAALQRNPNVVAIEPDGIATTTGVQSPVPSWGLDRIDQRWIGIDNSYTYPNEGIGVTVYIIDTGIRFSHEDFGGRAVSGWDFFDGDADAADCNGHGTHVAGTVGGTQYGVAKSVTLVAVRVFGCSGGTPFSTIIAAVDWVTGNAIKPAVANMSLGGPFTQIMNDAVTNSIASGIVYSISAGNSNWDACQFSPASTPAAITVGASDVNDLRANYSNYGTCLDLFAPGSAITSAWVNSDNGSNTISGTSMSAPHVAGGAALILSVNPSWAPAQIRDAMVGAATSGHIVGAGSGSPNRLLFVDWTQDPNPPPPPPAPDAAFTISCSSNVCTFRSTTLQEGTWYFSDWGENYVTGPVYARPMSTHDPVTLKSPYTTVVRHVVGSQEAIGYVRCNRNFKCQASF